MRARLSPLALALAAVLAAPAVARSEGARRAPERAPLSPADELVLVVRKSREADANELAVLEARLARVAPAAVERALDVLAARKLPAPSADERDQTLSEPQTALLLAAYGGLGREQGWSALDRWLGNRRDVAVRAAALQFGAQFARGRDLGRFLELASEPPKTPVDARVVRAWEDAVVRVLGRDHQALAELASARSRLHADLVPAYLRALGRSRDERAFDALERALEAHQEHAMLALAQVRLLPPPSTPAATTRLADRLRNMVQRIDPGRPELVQAVLLALGQLEDTACAELLVEFLGHESRGVAGDARWALERITDESFGADAARWARWLADEREWYAGRRATLLDDLAVGRPDRVSPALRELVAHPLFRHELADDLAPLLGAPTAGVRVVACKVLGELGSPRASRPLLDALSDDASEVAAAAHAALERLAGRDLPQPPAECRRALFPAETAL